MCVRFLRLCFFCVTALFFVSCMGSLRGRQAVEQLVREGNYADGVEAYKKIRQNANNAIQWKFDLALLEHFAGQYGDSIKLMNEVHELMENSVTKSITQGIGSAVVNDKVAAYTGTVYEYLYINAFNALNYYYAGDFDEALVEVRRIENKQREYMAKYGESVRKDSDDALRRLGTDSGKDAETLGVDINAVRAKAPAQPVDSDVFRDSSFVRYVGMVLRLIAGDVDNAMVDARALSAINQGVDVSGDLSLGNGYGRMDFLAFGGMIAKRREKALYFPGDFSVRRVINMQVDGVDIPPFRLKFVYPAVDVSSTKSAVASVRVVFSDGSARRLDVLEDFNRAVAMDVAATAPAAFARSVMRSITRKAVAVASGAVALKAAKLELEKEGGSQLTYDLAYASATMAIDAIDLAESADVRQCVFLPQKCYAGGVTLAPGTYSGEVQFLDAKENILYAEKFRNISVKNGKTVLMESSCLM